MHLLVVKQLSKQLQMNHHHGYDHDDDFNIATELDHAWKSLLRRFVSTNIYKSSDRYIHNLILSFDNSV